MKKIALMLTLLMMTILMMGCNESNVKKSERSAFSQVEEEITAEEREELKVTIESEGKGPFFYGQVNFTPVLEGKVDKELQYHWIIEGATDLGSGEFIDGFIGENGPVTEVINSGEPIKFGVYAEVSYVEGAYSERKVILKVEEKDTGKVLASDELTIENREGIYSIRTSKDDELIAITLKTSKARLYAKIIDTLWGIDSGLNSDVKYISIDTKTFKEFDDVDKAQLFEYLEKRYDAEVLDMSIEELEENGYVSELSFKDGILFKVDKYTKNSSDKVYFDGMKWASGNGSIGFTVEARYKDGDWEIKKCNMTWIS